MFNKIRVQITQSIRSIIIMIIIISHRFDLKRNMYVDFSKLYYSLLLCYIYISVSLYELFSKFSLAVLLK